MTVAAPVVLLARVAGAAVGDLVVVDELDELPQPAATRASVGSPAMPTTTLRQA